MKRVAVVHDYFTQQGGAERVAEQMSAMLPEADVLTTVALPNNLPAQIRSERLRTSWMQHLPGIKSLYRLYFPLYPLGVSSLDLSEYDLVLSSSSGYVKGVRTRRDAFHICYCHTPMRWVWRYRDYAKRENFGLLKRAVLPLLIDSLKNWDMQASRQPDQYVANSRIVAERIEECYGRKAVVIPPPIDVDRFSFSSAQDDYYLVLSRLAPYKRIDVAIEACNLLKRHLVVIGSGTDSKRLQELAGPTIEFKGRLSDEETNYYAGRCRALLFPGEEDFGMVPLEIASAGRPTIAYRAGGATESVVDGITGVFFDKQDARSLAEAIQASETMSWNPHRLRAHASTFNIQSFRSRFQRLFNNLGVDVAVDEVETDGRQSAAVA